MIRVRPPILPANISRLTAWNDGIQLRVWSTDIAVPLASVTSMILSASFRVVEMGFSQMTPRTPALEASQIGSTCRWSGVATLTTSRSWASSISWWEE